MTIDDLASRAGLSRSAVAAALKGRQAIAMEVFVALCRALDVDGAQLFTEAVRAEGAATQVPPPASEPITAPEPPLSMQEVKQRRLLGQAQPATWAADDRPLTEPDDDWEPR